MKGSHINIDKNINNGALGYWVGGSKIIRKPDVQDVVSKPPSFEDGEA